MDGNFNVRMRLSMSRYLKLCWPGKCTTRQLVLLATSLHAIRVGKRCDSSRDFSRFDLYMYGILKSFEGNRGRERERETFPCISRVAP